MKTEIVLTAALTVGLALTTNAFAEPFNDRGALFADVAPTGSARPLTGASLALEGFNQRGSHFTESAPVGSPGSRGPQVVRVPSGFNNGGSSIRDIGRGNSAHGNAHIADSYKWRY